MPRCSTIGLGKGLFNSGLGVEGFWCFGFRGLGFQGSWVLGFRRGGLGIGIYVGVLERPISCHNTYYSYGEFEGGYRGYMCICIYVYVYI